MPHRNPPPRKKRVAVWFTDLALFRRLKLAAKTDRMTLTRIVQEAVEHWLTESAAPDPLTRPAQPLLQPRLPLRGAKRPRQRRLPLTPHLPCRSCGHGIERHRMDEPHACFTKHCRCPFYNPPTQPELPRTRKRPRKSAAVQHP